jgi:hypothetical protein
MRLGGLGSRRKRRKKKWLQESISVSLNKIREVAAEKGFEEWYYAYAGDKETCGMMETLAFQTIVQGKYEVHCQGVVLPTQRHRRMECIHQDSR